METIGQIMHQEKMNSALESIPKIYDALRRANEFAACKELYAIGAMTKPEYVNVLERTLKLSGFERRGVIE